MKRTLRPIAAAASLLGLIGGLQGCGDESTGPEEMVDHTIEFPTDVADLQTAISQAVPGDTVIVASGTHAIGSPIGFASARSGVTLLGSKDTARGGSARPSLVFSLASNTDAITVDATDVRIEGIEIEGTFSSGVVFLKEDGVITNCIVRGATRYGIACTKPQSDTLVERNLILNVGLYGVFNIGGAHPLVRRNTIVGAGDCAIYSFGATPNCRNNILVDSANYGVACFGPGVPALDCNAFFNNTNADYSPECTPGASDFHADPRFCDPSTFTLYSDSPCTAANAGTCGAIGAVDDVCALTGARLVP